MSDFLERAVRRGAGIWAGPHVLPAPEVAISLGNEWSGETWQEMAAMTRPDASEPIQAALPRGSMPASKPSPAAERASAAPSDGTPKPVPGRQQAESAQGAEPPDFVSPAGAVTPEPKNDTVLASPVAAESTQVASALQAATVKQNVGSEAGPHVAASGEKMVEPRGGPSPAAPLRTGLPPRPTRAPSLPTLAARTILTDGAVTPAGIAPAGTVEPASVDQLVEGAPAQPGAIVVRRQVEPTLPPQVQSTARIRPVEPAPRAHAVSQPSANRSTAPPVSPTVGPTSGEPTDSAPDAPTSVSTPAPGMPVSSAPSAPTTRHQLAAASSEQTRPQPTRRMARTDSGSAQHQVIDGAKAPLDRAHAHKDPAAQPVEVTIGRVEVRLPPEPAIPPPRGTSIGRGFGEMAAARRYLDRVWR